MKVRTRYAPSPTGFQHIGGIRTALYCYLFAKKHQGDFILRIEDTDQSRYVEGAEEYIYKSLEWLNMRPDESPIKGGEYGPYRQSERKALYRPYAEQLIAKGYAYYAFDTSEELDKMREDLKKQGVASPQYNTITRQYMKNSLSLSADEVQKRIDRGDTYVIRIKVPRKEEIKIQDIVRGWVSFHSSQIDDKVIFKSDGMPTYHLANVVDDHLMQITHVIRGEEWLPSAPIHALLYQYLGWEESMPSFAHLPLLLKPDGKGKLSKRDGDRLGFPVFPLAWTNENTGESSGGYKEMGFLPEAFINILAFLGWNPGTDQELFDFSSLMEAFTLERIGRSGAKFDFDKAKWFNQQYLKRKTDEELTGLILPVLQNKGYDIDVSYVQKVVGLIKERAVFATDIPILGYYFFEEVTVYDKKTWSKKWKKERLEMFDDLLSSFKDMDAFKPSGIEAVVKAFIQSNTLKYGDVLPILRIALTGTMQGPPVFEMISLLGVELVVHRLQKAFRILA